MLEQARDILIAGGWVMYPLLALSVLSIALTVERTAFWARTHGGRARRLLRSLHHDLRRNKLDTALAQARSDTTVYAALTRTLLEDDAGPATESAALEQIERLRPRIERSGVMLATIVAAAPLLGILGTVTGIIESFDLLGSSETVADPTAVAAGIAEALFTTAFGLAVALVTIFPYALFRAHAERCLGRLEALGAAITETATRREAQS